MGLWSKNTPAESVPTMIGYRAINGSIEDFTEGTVRVSIPLHFIRSAGFAGFNASVPVETLLNEELKSFLAPKRDYSSLDDFLTKWFRQLNPIMSDRFNLLRRGAGIFDISLARSFEQADVLKMHKLLDKGRPLEFGYVSKRLDMEGNEISKPRVYVGSIKAIHADRLIVSSTKDERVFLLNNIRWIEPYRNDNRAYFGVVTVEIDFRTSGGTYFIQIKKVHEPDSNEWEAHSEVDSSEESVAAVPVSELVLKDLKSVESTSFALVALNEYRGQVVYMQISDETESISVRGILPLDALRWTQGGGLELMTAGAVFATAKPGSLIQWKILKK